jgi:hypothetical protein
VQANVTLSIYVVTLHIRGREQGWVGWNLSMCIYLHHNDLKVNYLPDVLDYIYYLLIILMITTFNVPSPMGCSIHRPSATPGDVQLVLVNYSLYSFHIEG